MLYMESFAPKGYTHMMTLNDLKKNETGVITEIHLEGLMKRRLIDMGVTTGASITMLRTAPLGDPVEFYILGYNLSLRKKEAGKIMIKKAEGKNGSN